MDGITINTTSIYSSLSKRNEAYLEILGRSIEFLKQAHCIKDYVVLKSLFEGDFANTYKKLERFFEEDIFDSIKIVMCFENYLKGLLIKKGYLVHEVDVRILNGKFKRLGNINQCPIKITDYKRIEGYFLDPIRNYEILRGLKEKTIQLNTMLSNPLYVKIINLPEIVNNAILNYNERRKVLHLKLIRGNYLHSKKLIDLETIINYSNSKLIKDYNAEIQKKYSGKDLQEREYKYINVA